MYIIIVTIIIKGGELYDQYCEKPFLVKDAFWNSARACMRTLVLDDGRRLVQLMDE